MTKFQYRIYYENNGPTACDPLNNWEKSLDEIPMALSRLIEELKNELSSRDPVAIVNKMSSSKYASIFLEIDTTVGKNEVRAIVEKCLNEVRIFGQPLTTQ
ncbi:MAG: hypothetical protein MN733_26060 [Nitrososphaera sp.]|nr:hypothetical protein [Nitrososphaera sp.]